MEPIVGRRSSPAVDTRAARIPGLAVTVAAASLAVSGCTADAAPTRDATSASPLPDEVVSDPLDDLPDDRNTSADATVLPESVDVDSVAAYRDAATGALHVTVRLQDVAPSRVKNGYRTRQEVTVFVGYAEGRRDHAFETNLSTAGPGTYSNGNDAQSLVPRALWVSLACRAAFDDIDGRFDDRAETATFVIPPVCVERDPLYVSASTLAKTDPVDPRPESLDVLGGDNTTSGRVTAEH